MEIEILKEYLKENGSENDLLIESLKKAAEEYLLNAGVAVDYSKELYALAIKLLVSHWYDNRTVQNEKTLTKLPFSLDAIIMQLK